MQGGRVCFGSGMCQRPLILFRVPCTIALPFFDTTTRSLEKVVMQLSLHRLPTEMRDPVERFEECDLVALVGICGKYCGAVTCMCYIFACVYVVEGLYNVPWHLCRRWHEVRVGLR